MHWVTIVGIIVIAFGTFLTYHGSTLSNKKDKEQISDKIEEVGRMVELAKAEAIPPEAKEVKLDSIQEGFRSWAEQLEASKEERRIELDKNEVELRERKLKLNKEWRASYERFFLALKQMVAAYNDLNGDASIELTEFPVLPANIYDSYGESFMVLLKFNEELNWSIWLDVVEPLHDDNLPAIEIHGSKFMVPSKDHRSFIANLRLNPSIKYDNIRIDTRDHFTKAGFNEPYQLDKEGTALTNILKRAFEYQLISSEK